ncbi:hypothetical protein [Ekhidna sp.]
MSKLNVYKIGLILMLLVNGILIVMMFSAKGGSQRPFRQKRDLMQKISRELDLNIEQEEAYFELAKVHGARMRRINHDYRNIIKSYFFHLKNLEQDSIQISKTLEKLKSLEEEKLTITYQHFEDLRDLCNEEQQTRYELVVDDIANVLVGKEKNQPPPSGRSRN